MADAVLKTPPTLPAQHKPGNPAAYEADFFAWTEAQAKLLAEGRFDKLDCENLIEEILSMGRSDKRGMKSHFDNLLMHLLKYRYQPEYRSTSWRGSIREARKQIDMILKDSPSLRRHLVEYAALPKTYKDALIQAADETGLPISTFPPELPFTLEEMLDEEFWPE